MSSSFSIIGQNAASLACKKDSLFSTINTLKPSCLVFQEVKFTKIGQLNIPGYHVFEKIRKDNKGGGLLTAIDNNLDPVSVDVVESTEILTVEFSLPIGRVRLINAYGPQEYDQTTDKANFWLSLEEEVIKAKTSGCMILIQMDANAKVGKNYIENDPNEMSPNSIFLANLITEQNLILGNSHKLCKGLITRQRKTLNGQEESIIDYVIFCENLETHLEEIVIDEERKFSLYRTVKHKQEKHLVYSDHNMVIGRFSIKYPNEKPQKIEFYNFKSIESKQRFFTDTNTTTRFTECFERTQSINNKCTGFFRQFKRSLYNNFEKIRINKSNRKNIGNKKFNGIDVERRNIVDFLKTNKCKLGKKIAETTLRSLEENLSDIVASENVVRIEKMIKDSSSSEGKFSQSNFWKMKKSLFPEVGDPPIAKRNNAGTLVTSKSSILSLYLETFKTRLSPAIMNQDYEEIYQWKEELWRRRMMLMKEKKTPPWKMTQLNKAMKLNKARDPHGISNDLFKEDVVGNDLKEALLKLFNMIREEQFIPDFFNLSNITTISKPGSKQDMNNQRGIFGMTVWKRILENLLYDELYEIIDDNMSESNIGGRRKRMAKDHLFLVYGVINEVINGDGNPVEIMVMDIEKAYDKLNLRNSLNDIIDTIPNEYANDKISLLFKTNERTEVAIKTPFGLTERITFNEVVQQGGCWGGILCSNTIDKSGNKTIERDEEVFKYKDTVSVPDSAFIDDILSITECGQKSLEKNIALTKAVELLRLSAGLNPKHAEKN